MKDYEVIIGLETHIQLNTQTKIFCSCKADSWGAAPNTNICPVCSGMPGVLPVLNSEAVHKGSLLAVAMHAEINPVSHFDRKNYFYPDLPKGYQITQFDEPIGKGGYLDLQMPDGGTRRVHIHKLHLEEDAGKTKLDHGLRLVDFNRCGVPLVEMVTEPDLRSGEEAAQYLSQLRQLLRWIGVSEADMERGHLRCDANVSIRERGSQVLNTKTEIKNVNSIDAVRQAINEESKRQIELVESGGKVVSYTLDWDANTGKLSMMRSKETEADYRYFREPDLLPVVLSQEEIARVKAELPELPLERKARFESEYELSAYDAEILTSDRGLSEYFESAAASFGGEAKTVSNWMMNDLSRLMNDLGKTASELVLTPASLAQIIRMVEEGKINAATGRSLLRKVEESGRAPAEIVEAEGLAVIADSDALRAQIEGVLAGATAEVESFRAGKESLLGWFVGQVMRATGGKADPKRTREILLELLK
ncbi:MAG: Asp-tRNA(Asn)/Glu-tRNA(Gln) amidotransferase subunit GatB [Anaerolineaceae bacterium]|jgi:aspartyl-tRNA(Asn)/glutamyl-tRNA(Gln) amidotransferase subunit B|nr:Asp-tRNA(Asn)/Glu-tRNA(Gln) amidotransferase subunit GatB [Anaerolineaceae bacterium]MDI9531804.1 Asp-tRNA(Asn)/Glu-tRNA(Gln) amidotransferase subunit GatB [Chloroflexota bacterium]